MQISGMLVVPLEKLTSMWERYAKDTLEGIYLLNFKANDFGILSYQKKLKVFLMIGNIIIAEGTIKTNTFGFWLISGNNIILHISTSTAMRKKSFD